MQLENNEQALLSALLKKGELIKEITLTEEHFDYVPHKKIFAAMKSLEERDIAIDIVTVDTQLGQDLLFLGGSEYLGDLKEIITDENNIKTYEFFVLEEYKIRKLKELSKEIDQIYAPKDIDKMVKLVEEMTDITGLGKAKEFDMDGALMELDDFVDADKIGINGIPTGFTELDQILDGLEENDLAILGARPSVGKTAFSLGITKNVCQAGHFVDFFSLEMSERQLLMRMISSIGNINSMKLKDARRRFNDNDWKSYQQAQGMLSTWKENLAIYDESKITVQQIRSRVKESIRNFPDKRHLVIVDYITLIQGSGRRERHLEVGEISRALKRLARDLKIPVLLLAQLSRGVEQRQDKRPMLSDLRDSGEIEQDADKILFLHRDDYFDKDTENKDIIEVITSKNRNGALGTVSLAFIKETQKFINLERRYEG